ncbi:MAG: methylmalonyl-CoA mutase [Candidatus Eisenbacteria bacterium]
MDPIPERTTEAAREEATAGGGEAYALEPSGAERKRPIPTNLSNIPLKICYGAQDVASREQKDREAPGEYPFTRGIHADMYRGKVWTMRMFAGFGTPEHTNERFHYLLRHGQTGLSTAFDMPTLMGYDPDEAMSLGEVGREGVSVASLEDMEILFGGIPLDQVTTSMTINATAIILLALYVAVAERQGVGPEKLRGTLQNDILKEFIAQKEWISPPEPSMRIIRDMLVYCTRHMPGWNTISISGYHIREAGATAVQELAFTLADGIAYMQAGIEAGLEVDDFAPRLSFFFDVHNDFFEEIAKFRAARRMWARIAKDRFGAKKPRSWLLRTHAQTAGVSLTAQQPHNNVVRVAIQALAGVLGGTQSLHTNSLDETYALPTQEAVKLALRTQQILADESGVANVVDPLGGSYYVEWLTDEMERRAAEIIERIDAMGGMVRAIHQGYPQKEIAASAYRYQREVEAQERVIVGVNRYVEEGEEPIPTLKIDPDVERRQVERIRALRARRDAAAANAALARVEDACRGDQNLVYPIVDAMKTGVTLGEVCAVFRKVFGVYRDPGHF